MECNNCGKCCCDLSITEKEYERIKRLRPDVIDKFVKTLNMYYCFGNCPLRENEKCSIYNDRPNVCRAYPLVQGLNIGEVKFKITTFCPKYRTMTKHDIKIGGVFLRLDLKEINLAKYTEPEILNLANIINEKSKINKKDSNSQLISIEKYLEGL